MSPSVVDNARDLLDQGKRAEAIALLAEAATRNPRDDALWLELAHVLICASRLDEAEKALYTARRLNPKAPFLWRYFADLHKARNDTDQEITALKQLHTQKSARAHDLIRLGNLYFNSKQNYGQAIQFYRHVAAVEPSAIAYCNLGLALSNPEVSRDLDAADAYRRALKVQPDYALAKQRLDATATKLTPLAQEARKQAEDLVSTDHRFQFYINPIELLRLDVAIDSEPEAAKKIQRAMKQLLHEIELNDGLVSSMENLPIDRSRALSLADELHDEDRRCFHAIIHRNESLRRFLTHASIEHFLYSEAEPPEELWDALEDEASGVRKFLSKPFARQYDFVLSRAIDQRKSAVIEVMFDGRCWVEPEDEEVCLRGAMQRVRAIVQDAEARRAICNKPSLDSVQSWLDDGAIVDIFNLLPSAHFRDEQIRLVAAVRDMAVDCWNRHNDSELSAALLNLCKRFRFKSAELNRQLEEDATAVKQILDEARQHSFSTHVRPGIPVSIVIGVWIIAVSIWAANSSTPSSGTTRPPSRERAAQRSYSTPSPRLPNTSRDGLTYRVPTSVSAELDRDRQAVAAAEAKFSQRQSELDALGREIDRERLPSDQRSELAVTRLNQKIDRYNALLEDLREQQRILNQMIDNYNSKLRRYGR